MLARGLCIVYMCVGGEVRWECMYALVPVVM